MPGITTSTGLFSGINTSEIVNQLISLQRAPAAKMEVQATTLQTRQAALKTIQASLVNLLSSVKTLNTGATFSTFSVNNSDSNQLKVVASSSAALGDYQFRTVQTARTAEVASQGIANADTQTFGAGTLVFATGGGLDTQTSLSALNDGNGIRRGSIKITDRAGNSATIDLTNAYSVEDVLDAINANTSISVRARSDGGRLVLDDMTGSTASNLIVAEVNGGHAAADLGLAGNVPASQIEGSSVFQVTSDFSLDQINDGNRMRLVTGNDLKITLSDSTELDIDLQGSKTVGDVLGKINDATGNGGKLVASLSSDGRIELTDTTGGSSSTFTVENANGASVVETLGLNRIASGGVLTGRKLSAGINSVLLDNLKGGKGITTLGDITVTDRAGRSATLDLSNAETLDDVLNAINTARTAGDEKLSLTAGLNAAGTGIEIKDTSGLTASNLVIADVGGASVAAELGITANAASNSVNSGNLRLRYVNEATELSTYAPGGKAVGIGTFRITDSSGASSVVTVGSSMTNLGDVIDAINNTAGINVTASLNETGDGIAIIDDAGGASALKIVDVAGKAGTNLRLAGDGTLNGQGKSEISSRRAAVVKVESTDTLNSILSKVNASGGAVTGTKVNSGSPVNPLRLVVRSGASGRAGRLFVEEQGVSLGFTTRVEGRDAVLQSGADADSAYYIASSTNTFNGVNGNLNVTAVAASNTVANVGVTRNDAPITTAVQAFVTNYNSWVTSHATTTKFDTATNKGGTLQGNTFILRVKTRMDSLVSARYAPSTSTVRTLQDLGISVDAAGKLALDNDRLTAALSSNPQAVTDFFRTAATGFGASLQTALEGYTDTTTGAFKTEDDTLQRQVDSLADRVNAIDEMLVGKRDRLLRQFRAMEDTLASLTTAQTQISQIKFVGRDGSTG